MNAAGLVDGGAYLGGGSCRVRYVESIAHVFDRIFRVVSMGASVVVTQHRGAIEAEGERALARAGFSCSLWLGVICALLVGVWPAALLRLLHLPPELMSMAVLFIQVDTIGSDAFVAPWRMHGVALCDRLPTAYLRALEDVLMRIESSRLFSADSWFVQSRKLAGRFPCIAREG